MILIKIAAIMCFILLMAMIFLPQNFLSLEDLRNSGVQLASMQEDSDSLIQ